MAVAAYGSLVSLLHVLDNVHGLAELHKIHVDIKLIESLQEGVNCLVNYVEAHSESQGQQDLWRQISRVAFEAEEMFDLHVVDQIRLRSQGEKGDLGFLAFNQDVERLIQQVDFIKKDLLLVQEVREDAALQTGNEPKIPTPSSGGSSSTAFSSGKSKSTMVGFEEHKVQIMDRLTSDQRDLQIIPIVGMGGIGKTTLAQNIFDNTVTVEHFDLRIWVTISQEYSVDKILLGLVNEGHVKNEGGNDAGDLGTELYQKLYGRRYLIVMDDMWDIEAWNDLSQWFPNDVNGSRVIMTTRLADLGTSLDCHDSYLLPFLDEDDSWKLFCQTIFAQDVCPDPDLEEIGRSISESCKGLPLEIVVIGGHLANSDMTKGYWEYVAESMKSFGDTQDYQHCMEVLYLSYKNLPVHLKLSFLHMRVFQEDEEIDPSDLVERWISEGCIKRDHNSDLIDIGLNYLKDLSARNLIVWEEDFEAGYISAVPDEVTRVYMHDLFRELCIKEWEKEQFTCSPKRQLLSPSNAQDGCFHCGTSHQSSEATNVLEFIVLSQTTSKESLVICKDCEMMYSDQIKRPRLVKVASIYENANFRKEVLPTHQIKRPRLMKEASIDENNDAGNANFRKEIVLPTHQIKRPRLMKVASIDENKDAGNANFRKEIVLPTRVRYAKVTVSCHLEIVSPCMLQLLWNLQCLSFRSVGGSSIVLPPQIWELSQLRKLQSTGKEYIVLPNPINTHDSGKDFHILKYLWTLGKVVNWECTKDSVDRIPNLGELRLKYEDELEDDGMQRLHDSLCNLIHLQKLEFLYINNAGLEHAIFPKSLKFLILKRCRISWMNMMRVVGSLPNLEFLWLEKSGQGDEWKLVEVGFQQLKSLCLVKCDLRCWNADEVHFPKVESLWLDGLALLEDISSDIGNIATLQRIGIQDCHEKVNEWGKEIREEQQNMGNQSFRVNIDGDEEYEGQESEDEGQESEDEEYLG